MWKYVKFNRVNFSAFYFANLWFAFCCLTIFRAPVQMMATSIQNLFVKDFNQRLAPGITQYYSYLFVYLAGIMLTMILIMKPLNIHIPDTKIETVESIVTFLLITGFFFYSCHHIFDLKFPDFIPMWLAKFIGGINATNMDPLKNTETSTFWPWLSDWFWNIAPLGCMWYRAKTGGAS